MDAFIPAPNLPKFAGSGLPFPTFLHLPGLSRTFQDFPGTVLGDPRTSVKNSNRVGISFSL